MKSDRLFAVVLTLILTMGMALSNMSCGGDEDTPAGPVNDAADVNAYLTKLPPWEQHGFIGVVSTVPIISVAFNENNQGDDIFIRDPEFGILEWTD